MKCQVATSFHTLEFVIEAGVELLMVEHRPHFAPQDAVSDDEVDEVKGPDGEEFEDRLWLGRVLELSLVGAARATCFVLLHRVGALAEELLPRLPLFQLKTDDILPNRMHR